MHCLLFAEKETIRNANDINKYVSAEIPDKQDHPLLYVIVTTEMMHGPCSKSFPKKFSNETKMSSEGHAEHQRRNNGGYINRSGKN